MPGLTVNTNCATADLGHMPEARHNGRASIRRYKNLRDDRFLFVVIANLPRFPYSRAVSGHSCLPPIRISSKEGRAPKTCPYRSSLLLVVKRLCNSPKFPSLPRPMVP
jgi:hypothetical protein